MDAEGDGERQESVLYQVLFCAEEGVRSGEAMRVRFPVRRHANVSYTCIVAFTWMHVLVPKPHPQIRSIIITSYNLRSMEKSSFVKHLPKMYFKQQPKVMKAEKEHIFS